MMHKALIVFMVLCSFPLIAATESEQLQREVQRLQQQTHELQIQLNSLNHPFVKKITPRKIKQQAVEPGKKSAAPAKLIIEPIHAFHSTPVMVNTFDADPESIEFYPAALMADEHVVTYIAGTPIVSSPYLGSRPAFDGSDYIVNISSINRDIRLMQQRRRLYRAYRQIGYPVPNTPILAISGKVEPVAVIGDPYIGETSGDLTLGSSELDLAAALNDTVEAYIGMVYSESAPPLGGPRVANSAFALSLGFINIGDLDKSPYYFTAGQLYAPFGRFSSAMVTSPLTMRLARVKTRPFILGYKSQQDTGFFTAVYGFKSDTTFRNSGVGGLNVGYVFNKSDMTGEIGVSLISSLNDAGGMQITGSVPETTFGGFASKKNGSECVRKVVGIGAHTSVSLNRYNITAEWVGASGPFRSQDLSFNGRGAQPQALQLEGGTTFILFDRPSSISLGYQWSKDTLALNLPEYRFSGVFNISIWKDTVESMEYRHDIDFKRTQFANGAAPVGRTNANTFGTNAASDTLLVQLSVFF